jgi:sortase (surface protein transpeptidase)
MKQVARKIAIFRNACEFFAELHGVMSWKMERKQINKQTNKQTKKQTKNSMAFSPQPNYTNSTTAACRRILVPTFAGREVSRGQHDDPHGR